MLEAMEQTVKNPARRAMIRGVPVYRLTGVTAANLPVIKATGMWVHYRHLGDAGWCLAVPDPAREAVMTGLAEHGLGLEDLEQLPKDEMGLGKGAAKLLAVGGSAFTLFLAMKIGGAPGMLLGMSIPVVLLMLMHDAGGRSAVYGELLRPEKQVKRGVTPSEFDPTFSGFASSSSLVERREWYGQ